MSSRNRSTLPQRVHRDAERLIRLAQALDASGSRTEDRFWEAQLATVLLKHLRSRSDGAIEAALDALLLQDAGAYEILIEQCETLTESETVTLDGQDYDVLLVVAPLTAWTRYRIPTVTIPDAALESVRAQWHGHILAKDARLTLVPRLMSLDDMPRSFSETYQWLQRLSPAAVAGGGRVPRLPGAGEPTDINLLADARYLVAAVAVPAGAPMFRWQETPEAAIEQRVASLHAWQAQALPTLAALLPGCGVEALLPDAWYVANREADRNLRPLALRAALNWLNSAANITPDQLRAVICACGEQDIEEFRVGFTLQNQDEVIYGCIWPLFGREDDLPEDPIGHAGTPPAALLELLRAEGVTDIRPISGLLPAEFCEDCGGPLFPDPSGVLVHAEMPEDVDTGPVHFH